MARTPLSSDDVQSRLSSVPGWEAADDRLRRTFKFDSFVSAFGFMASAALIAEKLDHHPNWTNVYNRVEVELWTHDAGGLTQLDFELAAAMNKYAGE